MRHAPRGGDLMYGLRTHPRTSRPRETAAESAERFLEAARAGEAVAKTATPTSDNALCVNLQYRLEVGLVMRANTTSPESIFKHVVRLLDQGQRTSTYKLATMAALADFSADHRPTNPARELEVPIPDLGRRVMAAYWRQTLPFDGVPLRQSTTTRSTILDSLNALRHAVDDADEELTLERAAELATDVFRRAVHNVTMCLAQQPLPRLQRLPGAARSDTFLYEDSFLHDRVTQAELFRHGTSIRLRPYVAYGLAANRDRLQPIIRTIWVNDVMRLNRIPADQRQRIEKHLFGEVTDNRTEQIGRTAPENTVTKSSEPVSPNALAQLTSQTFASRLNHLFAISRSATGQPYSSGEVAAKIRQSGFPISVSTVSQLRSGTGPLPSIPTIKALARFFGVGIERLIGEGHETARVPAGSSTVDNDRAADNTKLPAVDEPGWGRVVEDSINAVAAVCQVRSDGCWAAPSNSPVRCRPRNNTGEAINLPKMPLHRWAWLVENSLTTTYVPTYLIQIRRSCSTRTCCNPEHLYATTPGTGGRLTKSDVAHILQQSNGAPTSPSGSNDSGNAPQRRVVLNDNLDWITDYCTVDESGCWLAKSVGPVACRAMGDLRPEKDLPLFAPHRWAWMVHNRRTSNPLPGTLFHVRRKCGNSRCCRPTHLYLCTPDGAEVSIAQAEAQLTSDTPHSSIGGKHHRSSTEATHNGDPSVNTGVAHSTDTRTIADRLNKLFERNTNADGAPLTSADVAASLALDGLTVSENLVERIRSGTGDPPNTRTLEALSYYFNVDVEYFTAGRHSADPSQHDVTWTPRTADGPRDSAHGKPSSTTTKETPQDLELSVQDLGQLLGDLAKAISECLARHPADIDRSGRLALLASETAAILTKPDGRLTISRQLLANIQEEWARVGWVTHVRRPTIERLSVLLNER